MSSLLKSFYKLLGLVGPLDESGEGYEPSPLSKMLAVDSKTGYKPAEFDKKYTGDRKVLVICTQERYLEMKNGKNFSTGNHPVETVHPLRHVVDAGFDFDVATPTGRPVCIENWALPKKDKDFLKFYADHFEEKSKKPMSLQEIAKDENAMASYACVVIPGGHGAMLGLPDNKDVCKILNHFIEKDKYVASICHGPAALLSLPDNGSFPYKGYKIACFPDSMDKTTPRIGYIPGPMKWYVGEKLTKRGMTVVNGSADSTVHVDRKLVTGASPQASEKFGITLAKKLLEEYAS